jgi:predicted alpha/beta hydrolase family esterase
MQMRKQVLFIHGAGEGAYNEDEKLVANLQHLLGSPYEVHYPVMQNEADPNYETWARQINENIMSSQGAVILVGHSLGASILMKFLTENEIDKPVAGVFLIATPYWGGDKGWKYEGYETLVLPTKSDTKLAEEVPLFLYHSRDDDGVPFAHLALYASRFPAATIRALEGRGHQLNNDLSEVADDIKATLK